MKFIIRREDIADDKVWFEAKKILKEIGVEENMKVKLQVEDIMSPEEEKAAERIKEYIDFELGVHPVGTYSEFDKEYVEG